MTATPRSAIPLASERAVCAYLMRWIFLLCAGHLLCLDAAGHAREISVGDLRLPVPAGMVAARAQPGIEPEWANPTAVLVDLDTGTKLVVAVARATNEDVDGTLSSLEVWLRREGYRESSREYSALGFKMARAVHEKHVGATQLMRDDTCVSYGGKIYLITWVTDQANYPRVRARVSSQIRSLASQSPMSFDMRVNWWLYGRNPVALALALSALAVWILSWKIAALWKSARLRDPGWFVALFLLGPFTLGILEILYIYLLRRRDRKNEGTVTAT